MGNERKEPSPEVQQLIYELLSQIGSSINTTLEQVRDETGHNLQFCLIAFQPGTPNSGHVSDSTPQVLTPYLQHFTQRVEGDINLFEKLKSPHYVRETETVH